MTLLPINYITKNYRRNLWLLTMKLTLSYSYIKTSDLGGLITNNVAVVVATYFFLSYLMEVARFFGNFWGLFQIYLYGYIY